jgi:drug/metabolite transporter (DMT)-like permease
MIAMIEKTAEQLKGHLASITTYAIFGINIVVSKSLLSSWMTPMGYTLTRILFGLLVFWLIGLGMKKEKVARPDLLIMLAGGFLGLVFSNASFSIGIKFTTSVIWSLIMALSPILILVFSFVFLKEKIVLRKVLGVILGIAGAILIIVKNGNIGGSFGSLAGIAIAFLAVLSYSVYIIMIKKISGKYSSSTIMKWMFLFAALMVLPFGFRDLPRQRIFSAETALLPVLQLGFTLFFASLFGYFLLPAALKRIKATTASMYTNIQPLAASVAAIVVGQDLFTWDKPAALLLVVAGVYLVTRD